MSLSMDAFALSMSYGIKNTNIKNVILTALAVGIFHFFMPLIGNYIGMSLFNYTIFKPKYILFLVFLALSIDMFMQFFEKNEKIRILNLIGTLFFAFSVSFDSLSVGLGIRYLYNNILCCVFVFCIISAFFTCLGFYLGKKLSNRVGRYSFLFGAITLFLYSIWILTK